MEKIFINKKYCINKDEQIIYNNKEIYINQKIYCKGTLLIENCKVYFGNTEINNSRYSPKANDTHEVAILVCGGVVHIRNCEIIEMNSHDTAFISDISNGISRSRKSGNLFKIPKKKNNDYKVFLDNCIFRKSNDIFRKVSLRYKGIFYISVCNGLEVKKCTFKNMKYCIVGNGTVSDTTFKNCKYIYQQNELESIEEYNCTYSKCKKITIHEEDKVSIRELISNYHNVFLYVIFVVLLLAIEVLGEVTFSGDVGDPALIKGILFNICLVSFAIVFPIELQAYCGITIAKIRYIWSMSKGEFITLILMYFICWGLSFVFVYMSIDEITNGPVKEELNDYSVVYYINDNEKEEIYNMDSISEEQMNNCYLEFGDYSIKLDETNLKKCINHKDIEVSYYKYSEILNYIE